MQERAAAAAAPASAASLTETPRDPPVPSIPLASLLTLPPAVDGRDNLFSTDEGASVPVSLAES